MKKIYVILTALLLASGITTASAQNNKDWGGLSRYAQSDSVVRTLPQEERRVVFIGNSITDFWYDIRPEFFQSNGYIGRGISGQTSYQFIVRFRQDVVNLHPLAVVINTATNDVAENTGPYDEERTMDNIKTMVDLATAAHIKVILTTTLPASHFGWNPSIKDASEKIARLNDRIRQFAQDNGYGFVDYYSHMVTGTERSLNPDYSNDGVHPTAAGYAVMEPLVQAVIDYVLAPAKP